MNPADQGGSAAEADGRSGPHLGGPWQRGGIKPIRLRKGGVRKVPYIDLARLVRVHERDPHLRQKAASYFNVVSKTIERRLPELVLAGVADFTAHGRQHVHLYWLTDWGNQLVDDQIGLERGVALDIYPEERILRVLLARRSG